MFEFLFKYRQVMFERGDVAFAAPWAVIVLALVLAAAAVPTVLRYGRAGGRSRPADRAVLSVARVAVFAVLLFSLFRPVLVLSTVVPQKNFVGVLLDDSRSMRIADVDDTPRGEFIRREFAPGEANLLGELSEKFLLRFFRFSSGAERVADGGALTFAGGRSNLGRALDHARQELSSVPLAGLVVVSDGADNSDATIDETLLSLKEAGVPVHAVGLGRETFSRDIEVTRVQTPRTVLKGTSLVVDLLVSQQGYGGRTVPLVVEDDARIVSTQDVELGADGDAVAVRVHFTVADAGPRRFTFRIPEQDGEMVGQNNVQEALILVQDRTRKVLYFEGEPRFELKFIRRAVQDDPNLQVVTLNRTAENKFLRLNVDDSLQLATGFPETREELFDYAGLILGSVEASYFSHDQLRMIADFVAQRGGGLLVLGGRSAFAQGGYIGTPVEDVLPVVMTEGAPEDFVAEVRVETTPAGAMHPVTQIAETEEASVERWQELPGVTVLNPMRDVKPGATTLLRGVGGGLDDPQVVLAFQRYGRGRAIALPIQDSWIWQMHADIPLEDQTHETFWRQLLRWLVSGVPDRVQLELPADRFAPGEPIPLRANVEDDRYLRVNNTEVDVVVTSPSGDEWSGAMDWVVDRDGEYQTFFTPSEEGLHRVEVLAREDGAFVEAEEAYFRVTDLAREYYDAEMRASLLSRLAEETGGIHYTPETASTLAEDISFTESGTTVIEQHELWNMPVLFLLLVVLVSGEWGYRRYRGLA